jgi:hypothetical protein
MHGQMEGPCRKRNKWAFEGRRGHFIPGMGGEMASWGEYAREVRSEIEIIS